MEASQITPPQGPQVGDKGLKKDALGFVSSLVIGVASTAPGYSLAATLGFIVAVTGIGLQAPAVLLVSFIPMLLIAAAYYYMNRADPDCGTTFSWVTRAMGPTLGWLGGWAIIVADIIVMANLAQIAGLYSFMLIGVEPSTNVSPVQASSSVRPMTSAMAVAALGGMAFPIRSRQALSESPSSSSCSSGSMSDCRTPVSKVVKGRCQVLSFA